MSLENLFDRVFCTGEDAVLKLKLNDTLSATHILLEFEVASNQIQTEIKLINDSAALQDIWVKVNGVPRPDLWTYAGRTLRVRLETGSYTVAWRKQ